MAGKIEILNTEVLGDIVLNKGDQLTFTKIIEEGCGCGGQAKKKFYQVTVGDRIVKVSSQNSKLV